MENYICVNNVKIELTAEQVEKLTGGCAGDKIQLKDIPAGETFRVGEYELVVLKHDGDQVHVLMKDLLVEETEFGSNNDFRDSEADDICREFAEVLADLVGDENIIEHTVDLTSDDGLKDYGTVQRKVSLLTCNQYREFVEILDKHKLDEWWWLVTPYSTPAHENANWVKCVSPRGFIGNGISCSGVNGVRPFCILNSNIFVSK